MDRDPRTGTTPSSSGRRGRFSVREWLVLAALACLLAGTAVLVLVEQPVTGGSSDRAAQSNLTNALTEASALYQIGNRTFSSSVTDELISSAPGFLWTQGRCSRGGPSNCVSFHVYAAARRRDDQVLVLAGYTRVCTYLVEAEKSPRLPPVAGDGPHQLDIPSAGTYYAEGPPGQRHCSATDPANDGFHRWFGSLGSVDLSR